jgi:pentatricopeptide repeat protein
MEAWTTNLEAPPKECAVNQSRILRRWVQERCAGNSILGATSKEMVEMLHRCLDSWRKVEADRGHGAAEAFQLVCLLDDAGISTNDEGLRPGNKAYSMCLNVLAKNPEYPSTCDDVLALLNRRREHRTKPDLQFYNACLHVFAKCSPHNSDAPVRAETLLKDISSTMTPDAASFVSIMHAWANSRLPGSAERAQVILDQMIASQKDNLSAACFNVCIDGWAKTDSPERSEQLLWRMHQLYQDGYSSVRPNQISFNSTINAWAKSRHPHAATKAEQLLGKMEQYDCKPTSESYTPVLDAWSRTRDPGPKVESMLDRLEEMHARGHNIQPPNKVSYLMGIRAWARTNQEHAANKAEALLRRMDQLGNRGRSDLAPCVVVYSALIDTWSRSTRVDAPERALALLREMQELSISGTVDVSPNTITLNSVLDAFARQGRADEAHGLLNETESMVSDGQDTVLPDIVSYSTVMKAYSKSRTSAAAEKASELLQELQKLSSSGASSLKPSVSTYTFAIVAWGNSQRHDAAEQAENLLWHILELYNEGDDDLKPNVVIANCVLRAWARSREGGATVRAESVFRWIEDHGAKLGIEPDGTSYLHMIQAWAHSGRRLGHKNAEKYFNRLRDLYFDDSNEIQLTTSHYNTTILALSKSESPGALQKAEDLVEEMLDLSNSGHNVAPNAITLHYFVQALSASDCSDRAERVVAKLQSAGVLPNLRTK